MSKFAQVLKFGIAVCVFTFSSAHASVLTWNLQDVRFDDGTTVTGSFDYDSATDEYSSWFISVEAASFLRAYDYEQGRHSSFVGEHNASLVDFVAFPPETNGRLVRLSFLSALTDHGGNVSVAGEKHAWECDNCATSRFIVGGSVSATGDAPTSDVPEPASVALLGLAVAALAVARRRKAA
ncbi:MAG: PEP-CTERM sorting domain-containing protein [Massilia sp.]